MEEVEALKEGKIIIYPTDTIWGIGCDATNIKAIEKVKQIKGRDNTKSLILLVKDIVMLKNYVEYIPKIAINLINNSITPITIIYPKAKNLPIEHLSINQSIGIRIPKSDFLEKLFNEFDKPLVSTSANFSNKPSPKNFNDIDKDFLKQVDYISNFEHNDINFHSSSSIFLILNDNEYKQIR